MPLLNATGIAVIAVALGRKKVLGNGAIGCSPTSMPTSLISDGWPIGDPFGKDSSRTLLTGAEIDANIAWHEGHLRYVLWSYFQYHHDARTHLSLNKDCPRPRPVQLPSANNNIIAFPEAGGLHHRYDRRAA